MPHFATPCLLYSSHTASLFLQRHIGQGPVSLPLHKFPSSLECSVPHGLLAHSFKSAQMLPYRQGLQPLKLTLLSISYLCSIFFHTTYLLQTYYIINLLSVYVIHLLMRMLALKAQGYFVCFCFVSCPVSRIVYGITRCSINLSE